MHTQDMHTYCTPQHVVTCMSCDHVSSTATEGLTVDFKQVVGASAGEEVDPVLHGTLSNGDQLQLLIQECNIG